MFVRILKIYDLSYFKKNMTFKLSRKFKIKKQRRHEDFNENSRNLVDEKERKIKETKVYSRQRTVSLLPFDNLILYISLNNYDNFIVFKQ